MDGMSTTRPVAMMMFVVLAVAVSGRGSNGTPVAIDASTTPGPVVISVAHGVPADAPIVLTNALGLLQVRIANFHEAMCS